MEIKTEPKDEEGEVVPEEFRKVDEAEGENKEQYVERNKLFAGFKFFINREVFIYANPSPLTLTLSPFSPSFLD